MNSNQAVIDSRNYLPRSGLEVSPGWVTVCIVLMMGVFFCPWFQSVAYGGCPPFESAVSAGNVEQGQSVLINEASGIAASNSNANIFWVNNDSGDYARIYAINQIGQRVGTYNLTGATRIDYEDIAVGPGPAAGQEYIYIGEIGDNYAVRSYITVYRVAEPLVNYLQNPVTVNLSGVESITLQYPDGARDAETLMIDPVTKDIYIISKRETYSRVYLAAYPQSTTSTITMEYKGQLPWGWAVGGAISPDGSLVIVRGYSNASIWQRGDGVNLWEIFTGPECPVSVAWEPQGEAICFDADGCGYYTVSEGINQPLYYYDRQGPCLLAGDFEPDGDIDSADLAVFAGQWLDTCYPEDESLVAHWQLDEVSGLTAFDNVGSNNGTLTNFPGDDTQWVDGQMDGAIEFDGEDEHVVITGYKGITGAASRTVTAWIKTDSGGDIIGWGGSPESGEKWAFRCGQYISVAVSGGYIVGTEGEVNDNNWHYVAAVLVDDGSPSVDEIRLYVDGVEINTYSNSNQAIDTVADADVCVGVFLQAPDYFEGIIDDVRIYDRALNEEEIGLSADLNHDGKVDLFDFVMLAENWLEGVE